MAVHASTARESPLGKPGRDWLASETQEPYSLLLPSALCGVEWYGEWEIACQWEQPLQGL